MVARNTMGSMPRNANDPDTSNYEGRFAARLNELVTARGLNPATFAEKLGVAAEKWANSRTTSLGPTRVEDLARILGKAIGGKP